MPFKIALLGAESTGKSELSRLLNLHLHAPENSVLVSEYLRTWCEFKQRTPRKEEQMAIATEQVRQINSFSGIDVGFDFLIADTTALTVAVYSDLLFNDTSLYDMALLNQRNFDVTLLMGLDLPWVADGVQRDGAHMQEPVDTALRAALNRENIAFQVVYGTGEMRLQNALRCLNLAAYAETGMTEPDKNRPLRLRHWTCERCSDPVCEHQIFRSLLI